MSTTNKLSAAIVAAFKANPEADKLLVTPDGNCFTEKNKAHAEYHARVSKMKLTEASRSEYATELDETDNAGNQDDNNANGGQENPENNPATSENKGGKGNKKK